MVPNVRRTAGGLEYCLRHPRPMGLPDGSGESERGFVLRSMTMALRRAPLYSDLSDRLFLPYVRELERRIDSPGLQYAIACDPSDPWLVLGFVIGEPRILTYLHVRGGFRGLGLATDLAMVLDIVPGVPYAAEFMTYDLVRESAGRTLPIGLAHGGHWIAIPSPWEPTDG